MSNYSIYSNLTAVKDYLAHASPDSSDDAILLTFIRNASRAIDKYTRRKFYPRVETRFYNNDNIKTILLDEDLLALQTLKTQSGACTVGSPVMWMQTGEVHNFPPFNRIVISDSQGSVLSYSGTPQRSQEVTGTWGYHEDYNNAWLDTGTSLAVNYTASAPSMNLAGAGSAGTGASDAWGNAPRMSVGDLLKIGDQMFHITGAGSAATIVNVLPYANGTTAVSHASGASIAKFVYEPDIEFATRRLAAWSYAQRQTPYEVRSAFPALGEVTINESLPLDVKERIERFKRPLIRGL